MNIYLIRHGQVNNNLTYGLQQNMKTPLGKVGKNQAILTGKRIADKNIEVIFSSEFKRTIQTAEIIKKRINKKIEISKDLNEINMGDVLIQGWEGIKKNNLEWYDRWKEHKEDIAYPDGESGIDVLKRTKNFFEEILNKEYENMILVTHGGVIRVILTDILGLKQSERFNVQIDNCSISKIHYSKSNKLFKVEYINDISHLE